MYIFIITDHYSVHIPGIPFSHDHATAAAVAKMMPNPPGIPIVNGRPPLVSY